VPAEPCDLEDLTLLGFLGLADTTRPTASEAVAGLTAAGIGVVMITGDHPVTARSVARTLGVPGTRLVTGPELAAADEQRRAELLAGASVFARVTPEQKVQVVRELQAAGRVVAMVGDGANDSAAIRRADVGIGIEAHGSGSARRAGDLVLTRPDVTLVVDALVEGRAMWRRVRDAVSLLVGGNAGEVAFTVAGTALAGRAPINTRQFLVVNLFTDLLPSLALALAPTPSDARRRAALLAGRPPSLGEPLVRDILARGSFTAAGALAAWWLGRLTGGPRRASTIGLATLVGAELGQTLLLGGRQPLVVGTAVGSVAALVALVQVPVVSRFAGCTPLDPFAWAVVLACSAAATLAAALRARALAVPGRRAGV
jgi:cation-transporting ATPase I